MDLSVAQAPCVYSYSGMYVLELCTYMLKSEFRTYKETF